MTSKSVKEPSAVKSLCLFTNIINVRNKTAKRCIGSAKSKRRAMKVGNSLWKEKKKMTFKTNDKIKCNLYAWITHHHKVF